MSTKLSQTRNMLDGKNAYDADNVINYFKRNQQYSRGAGAPAGGCQVGDYVFFAKNGYRPHRHGFRRSTQTGLSLGSRSRPGTKFCICLTIRSSKNAQVQR
jgi:hypothetical protein